MGRFWWPILTALLIWQPPYSAHAELGGRLPASSCERALVGHSGSDATEFEEVRGKPVKLRHGSQVEGSVAHGGIQPHYKIDLNDQRLLELFQWIQKKVRKKVGLIRSESDVFKAIEITQKIINQTLKRKDYHDPVYLRLLEEKRLSGSQISLGDYVATNCGVCREHAMLTHLALEYLGIQSHYLYAAIRQPRGIEDHAFVLVEVGSDTWIIDTYNTNFNGTRLGDIRSAQGFDPDQHPVAPYSEKKSWLRPGDIQVLYFHDFPLYQLPRHSAEDETT